MSESTPSQSPGNGVTQRDVEPAEGQHASTGSEASAAYGEGSIQILEGLEAVRLRPGISPRRHGTAGVMPRRRHSRNRGAYRVVAEPCRKR